MDEAVFLSTLEDFIALFLGDESVFTVFGVVDCVVIEVGGFVLKVIHTKRK